MSRPMRFSFLIAAALAAVSCGERNGGGASSEAAAPLTIEEQGRRAFSACAICHSVKDPTEPGYASLVGPSLFGVVGAPSAHLSGYDYSRAMRDANLVWDDATLDAFLQNPQQIVPRTRMAFAGEPNVERRQAIIAFLKTLN